MIGVDPGRLRGRDRRRADSSKPASGSTAAPARWSSLPGVERGIDADPLDRQPQRWAMAGFRLVNR